MGASEWDYVEPFDTDLPTTLANLRRRVFDGRDYFWHESIPRPGTLADLDGLFTEIIETLSPGEIDYDDPRIIQLADIASSGTHSILDMRTVGDRGPITVLPRGEAEALFGAAKPSRADLERVGKGKWIEIESRWTGVCVPLHDESGTVTEVAFWGCSGD
jgi:hypothetical protein